MHAIYTVKGLTFLLHSTVLQNGSGEVSESASTSSLGSNSSHSKAPGAQLHNSNNTNSSISTAAQQKLTSILYNPSSLLQVVSLQIQFILQ